LESGATSMQSLPVRTTGQDFLHSWRHFYSYQYRGEELLLVVKIPSVCTVENKASVIYLTSGVGEALTDLVTVDNGNSKVRVSSIARVNRNTKRELPRQSVSHGVCWLRSRFSVAAVSGMSLEGNNSIRLLCPWKGEMRTNSAKAKQSRCL
jgi:hypothetical protein